MRKIEIRVQQALAGADGGRDAGFDQLLQPADKKVPLIKPASDARKLSAVA